MLKIGELHEKSTSKSFMTNVKVRICK